MSLVKRFLIPGLLCLLALPVLWIDVPLARFTRADGFPAQLRELLENLEPFGHGVAVAVIAAIVYCLDPLRRRHAAGVLLAAYGAGLAANLLKLIVARDRPWHIAEHVVNGLDTFGGLSLTLDTSGHSQSFPSAHAATAMGLAVALTRYYPRGGLIFYGLAVATAISRVVAGSHYASDTFVGLALGLVIGRAVVGLAWLGTTVPVDESDRSASDSRLWGDPLRGQLTISGQSNEHLSC